MTPSGPWFVWMVVGAVFGCLFLVACLMSMVKAVRDRHRIKARNKARRAAVTNGQAPGASTNCMGCNKRLRPNLIIIHDTEKEQRVKQGQAGCSLSTTSFSATSPGSLGSPEDLSGCGRAEMTTVAEVAGQPTGISCISGGSVPGDIRADPKLLSDDSCFLGNRNGRLRVVDEVTVDMGSEAIAFRRSSVTSCGAASTGVNSGLISGFPIPLTTIVDSVPFSDHCDDGDVFTDRAHRHNNGVEDKFNPRSTDIQDSLPLPHFRGTGRWSYPGFSKTINTASSPYCTTCERELGVGATGPRRNSYAAELSSGITFDLPRPRRHSDDYRHVISSSLSRLCPNAARSRRFKRDGADNPAYEELDDEGSL